MITWSRKAEGNFYKSFNTVAGDEAYIRSIVENNINYNWNLDINTSEIYFRMTQNIYCYQGSISREAEKKLIKKIVGELLLKHKCELVLNQI